MAEAIPVRAGTLIVLCGVSASGKSTFAARHFIPTEIVSSDECRALIADDPTNQRVSGSAFRLLNWLVSERLHFRRTTVVDSTALDRRFRNDMLKIAAEHKAPTMLILFDIDIETSIARDQSRPHPVGQKVIESQYPRFIKALSDVYSQAWDRIILIPPGTSNDVTVTRQLGTFDQRHRHGPFDIIGDIHGCGEELLELLDKLGYRHDAEGDMSHPDGRTLIFLGDLADRGPCNVDVFELVMSLVGRDHAHYTPGNHCDKLMRYLRGSKVSMSFGLATTVEEVEAREKIEPGLKERIRRFISDAPTYLWLDDGKLVVAHGGIKEEMVGKNNPKVKAMVLYGDTTGETNPDGTPVRVDWAANYHGTAAVVYGHTPVAAPEWRNNTINIDQGSVFGGWLTALRWPERKTVQVRAHAAYDTERTPLFLQADNLPPQEDAPKRSANESSKHI
ncbi:MAG: AAA family ATPase [Chloroflexota bacterium]